MNSTLNLSRHLFLGTIASRMFCLCFIFIFISAQSLFTEPEIMNLQEMTSLSIQLNKKTIQASSLEDQIFPMLISSKINKISAASLPRNPVDLVCIFGIEDPRFYPAGSSVTAQIEETRSFFKHLLPLMTDQDRLAVVLYYNPSYFTNIINSFDPLLTAEIPSLANTTEQNWETIIMNIDEKGIKRGFSTMGALKAAEKILSQRNETNRKTGVFISTPQDEEEWCSGGREILVYEIERAKKLAEIQDNSWIIQVFKGQPNEQREVFVESLAALRVGVIETRLLIKPEESDLLKGVEVQNTYSMVLPLGKRFEQQKDGISSLRSLSLRSGFDEFFFDLKIPKITQALPESPMEVKVASYQVVFVLEDGSEVVKSEDLIVKIVGEGEKFVEEQESKGVVRSFYHKWAEAWVLPTVRETAYRNFYRKARKLLRNFKESLDGSIVKDDEMLQDMWKELEEKVKKDEKKSPIRRY